MFNLSTMSLLPCLPSVFHHAFYLYAAPTGTPQDFTITPAGPRNLTFSWNPPAEEHRNGVITGYTLSCQPAAEGFPRTFATSGSYTLDGFTPATLYQCFLYASTSGGSGPAAFEQVTTLDDSKSLPVTVYIQLLYVCIELAEQTILVL